MNLLLLDYWQRAKYVSGETHFYQDRRYCLNVIERNGPGGT